MFAIHKALEVMVEKLTDSATVMRIHLDSRHVLQQLATGPALQEDRIGCKIWEKFVAISQRMLFIRYGCQDMQVWREMSW